MNEAMDQETGRGMADRRMYKREKEDETCLLSLDSDSEVH